MINADPSFGQQPQVANGVAGLMGQLYGEAGVGIEILILDFADLSISVRTCRNAEEVARKVGTVTSPSI